MYGVYCTVLCTYFICIILCTDGSHCRPTHVPSAPSGTGLPWEAANRPAFHGMLAVLRDDSDHSTRVKVEKGSDVAVAKSPLHAGAANRGMKGEGPRFLKSRLKILRNRKSTVLLFPIIIYKNGKRELGIFTEYLPSYNKFLESHSRQHPRLLRRKGRLFVRFPRWAGWALAPPDILSRYLPPFSDGESSRALNFYSAGNCAMK